MSNADPIDALLRLAPDDTERSVHDFPLDGLLPRAAISPGTRDEVADLLHAAAERDLVVVPQGARTALALGRPVDRYDVALDLTGLHRVVEYVPDDLTVTVEAGLTLRDLQRTLAEHGQYLPVDPPPGDDVTVGGMLATARPGAWRGHTPGVRDIVLGLTAAMPDGRLAKSGGRVVKNVSGYDLHRLHTGALGAFGVIVEASFKLAPLPAATRTVALRFGAPADAARAALELRDADLAVRALAVLAPRAAGHAGLPHEPHVLVELAGVPAAVERSAADITTHASRAGFAPDAPGDAPWARLRALAGDQDATVIRVGVPPTALAETLEAVVAADCLAWAHAATGTVFGHATAGLQPDAVAALRAHAKARGGYLQVESASPELRRRIDPFDLDELTLVRSLKEQFDPGHAINRGRWAEGL